jgi:hypothetical protein
MQESTYHQINSSYGDPFVFCLTGRGFYSEVNNLINAVLFGIVKKRRLYVDESRFAYGSLQWADFFEAKKSTVQRKKSLV